MFFLREIFLAKIICLKCVAAIFFKSLTFVYWIAGLWCWILRFWREILPVFRPTFLFKWVTQITSPFLAFFSLLCYDKLNCWFSMCEIFLLFLCTVKIWNLLVVNTCPERMKWLLLGIKQLSNTVNGDEIGLFYQYLSNKNVWF